MKKIKVKGGNAHGQKLGRKCGASRQHFQTLPFFKMFFKNKAN